MNPLLWANEYEGHWITTYTGKKLHYLEPQLDEIDIKDIAHALSLTCRFGGHCSEFYSVAEHCIRVAEIVPHKYNLQALLHDAGEAYLPDVPRPIKWDLPMYKEIENKIMDAILNKFNLDHVGKSEIKEADNILLATEARDLMDNTKDWADLPTPLTEIIVPMRSGEAELFFLHRFKRYSGV